MTRFSSILLVAGILGSHAFVNAAYDISYGDDADLTHFVTRPEIKAPILEVELYDPAAVSPGYFFVAPYARVHQEKPATGYYEPCQTGPHIYDSFGDLVWSGACKARNKNIADFRPTSFKGSSYLSAIDLGLGEESDGPGYGFVLDSSYETTTRVFPSRHVPEFQMYEFNVVDDGKSAVYIVQRPEFRDVSEHPALDRGGWVINMGFQEVDLASGKVQFEWWALDHISVAGSTATPNDLNGPPPTAWNPVYLNSVDKHADGDYLVSSRNTNCVYRISKKSGDIQWQLCGNETASSFRNQGFNFTRQHDARFLDRRRLPFAAEKGLEYISLVDNAVDEETYSEESSLVSSVLIIGLSQKQGTARLIRRIPRPDGGATTFGGNSHILPNGNLLASWAGAAYISEHDLTRDSRLVMEARFSSDRFTTYRAYKAEFSAKPVEAPVVKCTAIGTSSVKATVVCYVSWNGATEVSHWLFRKAGSTGDDGVIGVVARTGFETRLQSTGYVPRVQAEALNRRGEVIGVSEAVSVDKMKDWHEPSGHADL